MKKKLMSALLAGMLGASLVACSTSGAPGDDAGSSGEKITLRLGHWLTDDTPLGKQYNDFAARVAEETDGQVEVKVFSNAQLGNQRDLIEGVIAGTLEMTKVDDAYLQNYVPEYNLMSLPFMFEDYEHLGKVVDSDLVAGWDEKFLETTGVRSLGWSYGGFRHFITKEEVADADLGRMSIRVPESDVYIETITALNGNPTPMPWGEIYSGLETGVVEGLESAPADLYFQKFHDQAKYLTPTNHIQASSTLVINDKVWQKIPADLQKIIMDCLNESIEVERAETEKSNADAVEAMVDEGAILGEIKDRQVYIDKVQGVWTKFAAQIENGDELIEEIQSFR